MSKSFEDIAKISAKDEDWKYTDIADTINDFSPVSSFTDLIENDEYDIISNGSIFIIKESNNYDAEDINSSNNQLVSEYYKRPLDRFIAQQYQKCTGGFILNLKSSNEDTIKVDFHSKGLIVPSFPSEIVIHSLGSLSSLPGCNFTYGGRY